MYVLMPGESKQVEAASDPIGLKIGIVYDAAPEGQILMYQMWKVKNESVLTITYVNGGDISTFGGKLCHWNRFLHLSCQSCSKILLFDSSYLIYFSVMFVSLMKYCRRHNEYG
jgi:hypothetical protein